MKKNPLFCVAVAAILLGCTSPTMSPEPFVGMWIETAPDVPFNITQGVQLNADGTANSVGMATLQYEKWHLEPDSSIILTGKSIGNGQTIDFADTMKIGLISTSQMVLLRNKTYKIHYSRLENKFTMVDSLLHRDPSLGPLVERTFAGQLPGADCPGIDFTLIIDNQQDSGDGVYQMDMNYLEADNGKDLLCTEKGRLYTLRGDATDMNATVYQLIPFNGKGSTNWLRVNADSLILVNNQFERPQTTLNYYITLKSEIVLY